MSALEKCALYDKLLKSEEAFATLMWQLVSIRLELVCVEKIEYGQKYGVSCETFNYLLAF